MIEGFDVRTLALTNLILGAILGLGLIFFARAHPTFSGLRLLGHGYLFLALGFLLIGLRELVDDILSVVVANILVVTSISMIGSGILDFFQTSKKHFLRCSALFIFLMITSFVYLTYFQTDVRWRIIIISLVISAQLLLICYYLKSSLTAKAQFLKVIYYTFIISSLFFIFRILWTINEAAIDNYMSAGAIHGLAIIAFQLLIIIVCYTVSWSASENLAEELKRQATIDPLTQVYNRRALQDIADKLIEKAKRTQDCISIILIDLDHFKLINDNYGHPAGDKVLTKVSVALQKNLRKYDVLARFGGEEFIILLPDTPIDIALIIAEKLRVALEETTILLDDNHSIQITASFGVFLAENDNLQWQDMLQQTDQALYRAKSTGRNSVKT